MKNNQNKKTILQRIKDGIILAWKTPTLPENVIKVQSHPFIRILRVLGGLSMVLILTKKSLLFPPFFLYIFLALTCIFFISHAIISVIRVKHMYKTLKNDKLDVRNSPTDKFATRMAKMLWCIKGSCEQLPHLGLALSLGAVGDQILENSGRDTVFMPFLGNMLNKVIDNEIVDNIYRQRKQIYKELLKLDHLDKLLNEDKKALDALLKSEFLSEDDKKVIAKEFWKDKKKRSWITEMP